MTLLGVLFLAAGRTLLNTLSQAFNAFYHEIKSEARFVIVAQVTTFILREVLNFIVYVWSDRVQEWYAKSIDDNTWLTPTYIFFFSLFVELMPAASQLVSLSFSFKEKRKAIRFTEEQSD